ncbi:MAG TPA: ATP-binding protein [Candidatus Eisenbacteria bacterium]|nr:ATP-binding protein [Candidatus Eisenbacteria bacterium]
MPSTYSPSPATPGVSSPAGIARAKRRSLVLAIVGALLACLTVGWIASSSRVPWAAFPAGLALILAAGWLHRTRVLDLDRAQAREAQLTLYRVGDTLARFDREDDLVHHALDAVAEGTGLRHWALYAHRGGRGEFTLIATRGLTPEASAALEPDAPGPDARAHASRAAWLGEIVVGGLAGLERDAFAATLPMLGADAEVVSVPFLEHEGLPATVQCFLPAGASLANGERALLRWMAAQLASGLRRLRLERRDQILASYLVGTSEIVLELDLDGVVSSANRAAELALLVPPGELLGCRLDDLAFAPRATTADGEAHVPASGPAAALDVARASGEFSGELGFLRGDGSTFPAEVRLSPAHDRAGALIAIVLVARDITERREGEQDIRARGAELGSMNERLLDANHELEQARRLQNDFLANTSHELRTPLNAVIGFATLLEQRIDADEGERLDFARSIREAAEHLLAVINDLLDLAKAEAGRFELRLLVADVAPTIRAAVDALQPMASAKGLAVRVDVPREPLLAAVDLARFRQVLLNLLGNAVKFTDRGEVRVRAAIDAGSIVVSVEDTGVGIAPERRAALFSKYAQADPSYHRRQRGTGLGLAISRALVDLMGGTIQLTSEGVNRGTAVRITLPVAQAAAAEAESCES